MIRHEDTLIERIIKRMNRDNVCSVEELKEKIFFEVEKFFQEYEEELTEEEIAELRNATGLVEKTAERIYSREKFYGIAERNCARSYGNLHYGTSLARFYDVLKGFQYKCPYTGRFLLRDNEEIEMEHIIPVSMGGSTDDWNLLFVGHYANKQKYGYHLLDWWDSEHEKCEEYRLVEIYRHMVTRLRDFDKKKLNDNVNRWAKEKNRHHLYNKHLDAITFLYQLFDHIKKNCEYIFRGRILDKERDKEEINGVLEELWHEFAILYTKIKDKKSNRIERQDLANLVMVSDRLKKLGIICHYQIANNHCNKLRKMIENHVSNEEILEFCYQYDRIDNFEFFLQRLKRYYHTFKTWVIEKDFVDKYGFPLGRYYHKIINNEVVLNDTERQQFEEMIKFGMLVVREKQTAGKNSSHEDQ